MNKSTKVGKVSARISHNSEYFFKDNKIQGSGAVSALVLDIFPHLYEITIKKIKDIFNKQELLAILNTGKGNKIIPGSLPVFFYRISDALEHNCEDVPDKISFEKKAKSLSIPEAFILEIWINKFWYGNSIDDQEEYIK
jgi:hypothetical protein